MSSPENKDIQSVDTSQPPIDSFGVDKETSPGSQSPLEQIKGQLQQSSSLIQKHPPDDADTSSSLSAAPSPLTTHRPTSSKTSIDDQPLTPRDGSEKAIKDTDGPAKELQVEQEQPKQDAQHDQQPKSEKQTSPTPTVKPVEPKFVLPEDKLGTILQLNAELINVYNEFHAKGLANSLQSEFQQYSHRIQANVQWLMQYQESLGTQLPSRIPLQIVTPPPSVPFASIDNIKSLYTHIASLFKRDEIRDQRKQQLRQMMIPAGISASNPIDVNVQVNINGKRERTEDDHAGVDDINGGGSGQHSPRKRVDTGESKSGTGLVTGTSSPAASMHHASVSPERMHASPSNPHAYSSPAPGAPGGPLRPSSSQSNSSNHGPSAASMPPPPPPPGASNPNHGTMTPQQVERMRMMAQQNRMMRPGSTGSTMSMMSAQGQPGQQQLQPGQNPQGHQNGPGGPGEPGGPGTGPTLPFGIAPRSVPAAILPQLLNMIRNPQAHQSVQLLYSKIPDFRNMPVEQQAGVLWAFQQNQMRQQQQQQEMVQRQQMQMQMQPGQGSGQGGFQPNVAGMNMRPTSAGAGVMQPPPSPHSIQQQRQLNLMQQQQQAAMGRGAPPGMPVGYSGPMNPGMGMGGMVMGGHARMPSNPTMGPPPVPMAAASSYAPGGMNPYPQQLQQQQQHQGGGINPINMSYPMQQQQQPMYNQGMAGSPPQHHAGNAGWSPQTQGQGQGQALTPAAIMQQQQAKMAGMAPSPGSGGGGGPGSMDPNTIVNWQDLAAT